MANIKSQKKRNRQNERRRERNKAVRTELKTRVKVAGTAAFIVVGVIDVEHGLGLIVTGLQRREAARVREIVGVDIDRRTRIKRCDFLCRDVHGCRVERVFVYRFCTGTSRKEDENAA